MMKLFLKSVCSLDSQELHTIFIAIAMAKVIIAHRYVLEIFRDGEDKVSIAMSSSSISSPHRCQR